MLGLILSSVIKESTFLKVLRSVIGLKLFLVVLWVCLVLAWRLGHRS